MQAQVAILGWGTKLDKDELWKNECQVVWGTHQASPWRRTWKSVQGRKSEKRMLRVNIEKVRYGLFLSYE